MLNFYQGEGSTRSRLTQLGQKKLIHEAFNAVTVPVTRISKKAHFRVILEGLDLAASRLFSTFSACAAPASPSTLQEMQSYMQTFAFGVTARNLNLVFQNQLSGNFLKGFGKKLDTALDLESKNFIFKWNLKLRFAHFL